MDNKETMKYIDVNGIEKEAEVVLCFTAGESKENSKKYVIYTLNETDEKGMIILYTSVMNEVDGKVTLGSIETNEEWNMIKDIMKKVVVDWKGNE